MERTEIRKYQLAQLELLKFFHKKCAELEVDYYLVFGTLLGAIRHGGFIPWDADIDIAMFRDDYEIIKDYFIRNPMDELFYQHYETEEYNLSPHAVLKIKGTHVYYNNNSSIRYRSKHDGIYIDIFPIDNVLDDKREQRKQVKRIAFIRRLVTLKAAPVYGDKTSTLKRIGKYVVSVLLSPLSFHYLYQKADIIMKWHNKIDTEMVAILTDPQVFERQLFSREIFGTPQLISFEDSLFLAPCNAEEFLKLRYGDYKKLPPEDDRWVYLEESLKDVDYGDTAFLKGL